MSAVEQQIVPYVLRRTPERPLPMDPLPAAGHGLLQDAWAVLVRRWRLIASMVIALVGATGLYCLATTPYYRARATVLIEARGPQILSGQSASASPTIPSRARSMTTIRPSSACCAAISSPGG
jgi:uncharacterized protein involved in exopolysaccharide biosynthesis